MTQVRHLFVSYAREDQLGVQRLLEGVERLGHEIWADKKLSGGQMWWDEILARIRACDAMLIVLSPDLLDSPASALEREYARKLGKPLLPVIIRPVSSNLLPTDLAPLQFVDYTSPGPMTGFELAGALASLPAAPPLPDPLPDAPPVPVSHLSTLTDRVHAATLTLDEQLAIVAQLDTVLDLPKEREAGLELLQALQRRPDLFHATARQIEQVMSRKRSGQQMRRPREAERSQGSRSAASPGRCPSVLMGTAALTSIAVLLGVALTSSRLTLMFFFRPDDWWPAWLLIGGAGILEIVAAVYSKRTRPPAAVLFATHGIMSVGLTALLFADWRSSYILTDWRSSYILTLLVTGAVVGVSCGYAIIKSGLPVLVVFGASGVAVGYGIVSIALFNYSHRTGSLAGWVLLLSGTVLIAGTIRHWITGSHG